MLDHATIYKPLRPLFVISGLGYGGAETQLIGVVRELRRRGHEPHVYLLTSLAPRSEELASWGIPITTDEKGGKIDFRVIRRLRRYMQAQRIDLVHSFLFDANIYARIAGIGLAIPILNAERSSDYSFSRSQQIAHALTSWRVDGLVANSHAGRIFAETAHGIPNSKTYVNWNGIDIAALTRRCEAASRNYKMEFFGSIDIKLAVFVGSINETKDPKLALLVAAALIDLDPTWRVAFIGASFDGSRFNYKVKAVAESAMLANELKSMHDRLENKQKIIFIGRRADAVEIIAQSDVLFSTSIREGFPNVVLESMAVGTPVISTNYSDIKLILQKKEWVIDSREPRDMAKAIIRAGACRAEIGRGLQEWVRANATIAKSTDDLLAIYGKYAQVSA